MRNFTFSFEWEQMFTGDLLIPPIETTKKFPQTLWSECSGHFSERADLKVMLIFRYVLWDNVLEYQHHIQINSTFSGEQAAKTHIKFSTAE